MKRILMLLMGVAIAISIGTFIVVRVQTRQKSKRPIDNQLKWAAKEAKSAGKNRVETAARQMFQAEAISIDNVKKANDVLLVQVIDQYPLTFEGNWIDTWHKAVIIDTLSTASVRFDDSHVGGTTPPSLLPLNRGEIVFKTNGGRLVVDGVEITENGPTLVSGQQYVLFATLHPDGVATLHMGANSIFRVETGQVQPVSKSPQPHVIKDYVNSKGNSLEAIKAGLKGGPNHE